MSKLKSTDTVTPLPTYTINSFSILVTDNDTKEDNKRETFSGRQTFLEKSILINQNTNLKLKVNRQINKINALNNKNRECYSISWSMNTIYAGDSSIQTSKKIETSNACDNGTCSVVITIEKKKGKVYLVLGVK